MVVVSNHRNHAELRKKPRQQFHYNARIQTSSEAPLVPCAIVDISEGGALVAIAEGLKPGDTVVTDAGLEYLKGCTGLIDLGLHGTGVTDAGLAVFKGYTGLTALNLDETRVTDAGLEYSKDRIKEDESFLGMRFSGRLESMPGPKGCRLRNTLTLNDTVIVDTHERQGLRTLAPASVSVTAAAAPATTAPAAAAPATTGPAGADRTATVTIRNTSPSAVAFLLRADVRRGTASGQELPGDNELQSATWQDNDVTLFPGESQTLTVTYKAADLRGAVPVISVSGWNVAKADIAVLAG